MEGRGHRKFQKTIMLPSAGIARTGQVIGAMGKSISRPIRNVATPHPPIGNMRFECTPIERLQGLTTRPTSNRRENRRPALLPIC